MGLLDHKELMLVKGIEPVKDDTSRLEQRLVILNLMDDTAGFSLEEWSPNIPSLKGGGLWADSSISDGRTLMAGQNTNVTETMVVHLTGATLQVYAAQFAALQQMIQDARAFWDTFWQIEPVYLRWWANGAPGPQYALIYNIDLDVEFEDSDDAQATLTLSIEREDAWWGIAPGQNPKVWTYKRQNLLVNVNQLGLISGSDHLVSADIGNLQEWSTSYAGLNSQNYFTVSSSLIDGDKRASAELVWTHTLTSIADSAIIGISSKPLTQDANGTPVRRSYTFNAGDAQVGTDTTLAADTGAPRNQAGVSQRGRTTFATATMQTRLTWNYNNGRFILGMERGRFMVFVRARLSATASVTMQYKCAYSAGAGITGPQTTLTDLGAGGTGNTTEWALVYLGILSIPFDQQPAPIGLSNGIFIAAQNDSSLELQAQRNSGAGELYVSDLILMPIDEGCIVMEGSTAITNPLITWGLYDSTGYYGHGKRIDFGARQRIISPIGVAEIFDLRVGVPLALKPGVDNTVHFLTYKSSTRRAEVIPNSFFDISVRLNLVPSWNGIRDA